MQVTNLYITCTIYNIYILDYEFIFEIQGKYVDVNCASIPSLNRYQSDTNIPTIKELSSLSLSKPTSSTSVKTFPQLFAYLVYIMYCT